VDSDRPKKGINKFTDIRIARARVRSLNIYIWRITIHGTFELSASAREVVQLKNG
jgi:hypothetical protein